MRILDRIKRHWMGRQIWKAKMSEPLRVRIVDEGSIMAKLLEYKIVKFSNYESLDGQKEKSWRDEYLNLEGILCIYESENLEPGRKFLYFYPHEPENWSQRYLHTTPGELRETEETVVFESHGRYVFEKAVGMSEEDKKLLFLNVFYNPNMTY